MILPLLLPLAADAATLNVCATCTYTTIGAAVRVATSGDTIQVAAGVYDEGAIVVQKDIDIVGAGSDVTTLRSTADPVLSLGYPLPDAGYYAIIGVSGLSLEASSGDAIWVSRASVHLTDIRAEGFPGYAVQAVRSSLSVDRSTFVGNEGGIGFDAYFGGGGLDVTESHFAEHASTTIWTVGGTSSAYIADSTFRQNAGGVILGATTLSVVLSGNTFAQNAAVAGGAVNLGSGWLEGNLFCGNEADTGGAVYGPFQGVGNIFVGNVATTAGGDVYAPSAMLVNNTFVGGIAPIGGSVWWAGHLDFRNNIVAHTSEYGLYGDSGSAIIAYNNFWDVVPDAVGGSWPPVDSTNLAVDPMFVSYVEGGCEELDLGLLPGSALIDAGDPWTLDVDGTVADIGASGGTGTLEATSVWYWDGDGDGYGVPDGHTYAPTALVGYAAQSTDCDDTNADRHPGNDESCDGVDEDCDGSVDEFPTNPPLWYLDADGDGFQGAASRASCEPPAGWEAASGETDCDDRDSTVFPGAVEICDDEIDQDCDGDDLDPPRWRPDEDDDGFQALEYVKQCEPPDGWGADQGAPFDCDDEDASVFPGAAEIPGDRYDQDCDGRDLLAHDEPEGCRGCSSGADPSGALVLLAALVLRRRRAGLY